MDYAHALGMWEKNMLFRDSVRVGGNNRLTRVDTHLQIATVGTIVASIYSLMLVVSDVLSKIEMAVPE